MLKRIQHDRGKNLLQVEHFEELYEAAEIDGCTQARFFPDCTSAFKAIIAILVLYYGVGHWNSYFSALVYISDKAKVSVAAGSA